MDVSAHNLKMGKQFAQKLSYNYSSTSSYYKSLYEIHNYQFEIKDCIIGKHISHQLLKDVIQIFTDEHVVPGYLLQLYSCIKT